MTRAALLGLALYGRTDGLWCVDRAERARVLGLDRVVDLVEVLGGARTAGR